MQCLHVIGYLDVRNYDVEGANDQFRQVVVTERDGIEERVDATLLNHVRLLLERAHYAHKAMQWKLI